MVHVGGLKVEEVKEGRVVVGERGPRRGERRGEGSKALKCGFYWNWCLLFVLIRQGLRGGSGPLRLIRAPGIETGTR